MPLTHIVVQNARPREKQYKLSDSDGLHLLVLPTGGRYWHLDYRFQGKRQTLALGVFPEVSLAEAREKRAAARRLIAEGVDPKAKRKLDRLKAATDAEVTFKLVGDELLAKREKEGKATATMEKDRWLLEDLTGIGGQKMRATEAYEAVGKDLGLGVATIRRPTQRIACGSDSTEVDKA